MSGHALDLMQDESKGLGKWFASRIDARHTLRENMTCQHDEIKTWHASDTGEPVMWGCALCLRRFIPMDLERDKAAKRYETVRKMSLRAFGEVYHENLSSGKPFDEIIDGLYGVYFSSPKVIGRKR